MRAMACLVAATLLAACKDREATKAAAPPVSASTVAAPAPSPVAPVKFAKWTAKEAASLLLRLYPGAITSMREMEKRDYGLAPMAAVDAYRILIPKLGADAGGRVFSFDNEEDLARTKRYYDELGKSSAAFHSWTFVHDNVLVQLNGDLSREEARNVEGALAQYLGDPNPPVLSPKVAPTGGVPAKAATTVQPSKATQPAPESAYD